MGVRWLDAGGETGSFVLASVAGFVVKSGIQTVQLKIDMILYSINDRKSLITISQTSYKTK